jgi:hypothetical protein
METKSSDQLVINTSPASTQAPIADQSKITRLKLQILSFFLHWSDPHFPINVKLKKRKSLSMEDKC